jgi:alpha-1,6-mannosyltransferase
MSYVELFSLLLLLLLLLLSQSFDHLEFPGVVPRTFLGPLFVSAVALPFHKWRLFMEYDQFMDQYIVRGTLGLLAWLCFRRFRQGVSAYFGETTGGCLGVVFALQFHLPFYITRTLPNTFALLLLMVGYGHWFSAAAADNSKQATLMNNNGGNAYHCIG